MSEFDARKAFEEASERHEHAGPHGARWVPIAAAVLAVITAVFSLLTTQRSTESLVAKNEAILATTHANDAYNEYESRSIKQHIYEAQLVAGNARDPRALQSIVSHEKAAGQPAFSAAKQYEREATEANARSTQLLHGVTIMEIGITLLDIAIVLVSISAIASTRPLTIVAIAGAAGGTLCCIAGLLQT